MGITTDQLALLITACSGNIQSTIDQVTSQASSTASSAKTTYNNTIASLNSQLADGYITPSQYKQYTDAAKSTLDAANQTSSSLSNIGDNISKSIQQMAAAFASDGFAQGFGESIGHFGSIGSVIPNAIVSVAQSGRNYSIASVVSCWSGVNANTFNVTSGAAGSVTVSWPFQTFPNPVVSHVASINSSTVGMIVCSAPNNHSALITMADSLGAPKDLPFILQVF